MANLKRFGSFNESDQPLNDAVDTSKLPKKGLIASVYRNAEFGSADTTAGGITSKADKVVVVGPGIPEIFEPHEKAPAVYLDTIKFKGDHIYAAPVDKHNESGNWSFGGNFIYSSDSRFRKLTPHGGPIPVHDRFEDWATYNAMSK